MRRGAVALALIAGCTGAADSSRARTPHGDVPGRPAPAGARVAGDPDPGPPPPRDCSLLAPAIERILTDEIAIIERDRPANVAAIAIAEARTTTALLVTVLPARCEADQWSGAYTACIAAARTRDHARACETHLTTDQQDKVAEAIRAGAGPVGTLGIVECDQWEAITLQLAACDKFPAESRQALVQGVKQTMDVWRTQSLDQPARESIERACRAARTSIEQSLRSLGCQP